MGTTLNFVWEIADASLDPALEAELLAAAKQETALRLFRDGRISGGLAARLLGLTRLEFLDLLRRHGAPFVAYTDEELERDLRDLSRSARPGSGS